MPPMIVTISQTIIAESAPSCRGATVEIPTKPHYGGEAAARFASTFPAGPAASLDLEEGAKLAVVVGPLRSGRRRV
jgi:hypothetical protein